MLPTDDVWWVRQETGFPNGYSIRAPRRRPSLQHVVDRHERGGCQVLGFDSVPAEDPDPLEHTASGPHAARAFVTR